MKPSYVLIRTACLVAAVSVGVLTSSPELTAAIEAHAPADWLIDGVSAELMARLVPVLGFWVAGLALALPWWVVCAGLRGFNPGPDGQRDATRSFNGLIAVARARDFIVLALLVACVWTHEVAAGPLERWGPMALGSAVAVHLLGLYQHQNAHARFTRMMFDVFDRMLPGNRDRRL